MQPIIATLILMVAGRGIAQLITGGQIITVYYAPFFFLGSGYLFGLPFSVYIAAAVFALLLPGDHAQRARPVHPGGRHQPGRGARGRRAGAAHHRRRLRVLQPLRRAWPGLLISSNVKSADGNNAGLLLELDAILAVTLGGTALTGGRFSLAGSVIGALIIQTLTYAIYSLGVPPEINLVVKAVVVFAVMLLQSAEFRASLRRSRCGRRAGGAHERGRRADRRRRRRGRAGPRPRSRARSQVPAARRDRRRCSC